MSCGQIERGVFQKETSARNAKNTLLIALRISKKTDRQTDTGKYYFFVNAGCRCTFMLKMMTYFTGPVSVLHFLISSWKFLSRNDTSKSEINLNVLPSNLDKISRNLNQYL